MASTDDRKTVKDWVTICNRLKVAEKRHSQTAKPLRLQSTATRKTLMQQMKDTNTTCIPLVGNDLPPVYLRLESTRSQRALTETRAQIILNSLEDFQVSQGTVSNSTEEPDDTPPAKKLKLDETPKKVSPTNITDASINVKPNTKKPSQQFTDVRQQLLDFIMEAMRRETIVVGETLRPSPSKPKGFVVETRTDIEELVSESLEWYRSVLALRQLQTEWKTSREEIVDEMTLMEPAVLSAIQSRDPTRKKIEIKIQHEGAIERFELIQRSSTTKKQIKPSEFQQILIDVLAETAPSVFTTEPLWYEKIQQECLTRIASIRDQSQVTKVKPIVRVLKAKKI
jgi:hypothetical protein